MPAVSKVIPEPPFMSIEPLVIESPPAPSVVNPVSPPKAPALLYWIWVFEPPGLPDTPATKLARVIFLRAPAAEVSEISIRSSLAIVASTV